MGGTASKAAPTEEKADSDYYRQQQEQNVPVDPTDLVLSYVPRYVEYIQRMQYVASQPCSFEVYQIGGNSCGSSSVSTSNMQELLQLTARLKTKAVNRIVNEFCKQGRLHSDIRVVLKLEMTIPHDVRSLVGGATSFSESGSSQHSLPSYIDFRGKIKEFQVGFGFVGTHYLKVNLSEDDLKDMHFSGQSTKLVRSFDSHYNIDFDNNEDGSSNNTKECPVCLSVKPVRTMTYLPCGHGICTFCHARIADTTPSLCPLCRAPFGLF